MQIIRRLLPLAWLGAFLVVCAGTGLPARGQTTAPNEWTWVGGSSTLGSEGAGWPGIYGTQGVAEAANFPGSRSDAFTWTDKNGRFWLYGGYGYGASDSPGYLNDLWQFNPTSEQWDWVGGSNLPVQFGVYGTLGTPAPGNYPGARTGAAHWIDSNGNLWALGGGNNISTNNIGGLLNDLWELNFSTWQWTWMGGCTDVSTAGCSQFGVYGTLGTPSANNGPGVRSGGASWTDASGHLWLFGGYGLPFSTNEKYFGSSWGYLNDLWEFDPSTLLWTWMGGSYLSDRGGVYGVLGTPAAANHPGSRSGEESWADSGGHVWLFGGSGYDANESTGTFNDLWEFDSTNQQWTWKSGSKERTTAGAFGTLGVPDAGNNPTSRTGAATWIDGAGQLWLAGGGYLDFNQDWHDMEDLWVFRPSTNQWTWMGGMSVPRVIEQGWPGVYGVSWTPDQGNIPGSRSGAASWTERNGNLWLFGGIGFDNSASTAFEPDRLNDLWVYQPSNPPAFPTAATPVLSVPGGKYSVPQNVSVTDATPNASIYFTTDGSVPTTSSASYNGPIAISGNQNETLNAIAVAPNYLNSPVVSADYIFQTTPPPPAPDFSISVSPSNLLLKSGQTTTITVTVAPQNGLSAPVTFSCGELDPGSTCTFSPSSVTPAGAPVTTTLTFIVPTSYSSFRPNPLRLFPPAALAVAWCFLGWKRRRLPRQFLILAVTIAFSSLINGCGGAGSTPPPQSFTDTVTVSGKSGSLLHSASFTVSVN